MHMQRQNRQREANCQERDEDHGHDRLQRGDRVVAKGSAGQRVTFVDFVLLHGR
jgi:hypothetical protein